MAVIAASFAMLSSTPVLAQTVTPIQFARGATSSTINGAIKGNDYIDYRIVARAGQRLSVNLRTIAGSPYFNVMEPGSTGEAIYNSSMGDQRYSGTTARSGTYTIRVYQMRASGRRGEVARFQLGVSITGRSSANNTPTHRPGDALVPGTPYHATTTVRCRSMRGAPMGMCNAGVIRRPGSATVHLDTQDGGERTILFRSGRAVSSDSDNRTSVERRGDISIVRIGTVELYEIPDALVFGG